MLRPILLAIAGLAFIGAPAEARSDEGLRKRLEIEGADPVGNTSAEFGKVIKDEIAMWGKGATAAGITPK